MAASHLLRHDLEVLQCIVGGVGVSFVLGCTLSVTDGHGKGRQLHETLVVTWKTDGN